MLNENVASFKKEINEKREKAGKADKINNKALDHKLEAHQNNMLKLLSEAVAPMKVDTTKEDGGPEQRDSRQPNPRSYVNAARTTVRHHPLRTQWNSDHKARTPSLAEVQRPEKRSFQADELADLYFYMNLEGNLAHTEGTD